MNSKAKEHILNYLTPEIPTNMNESELIDLYVRLNRILAFTEVVIRDYNNSKDVLEELNMLRDITVDLKAKIAVMIKLPHLT